MSEAAVPKRTPGPAHVRLTMLALFALGLGFGCFATLLLPHALSARASIATAAGTLLAILPGCRRPPESGAETGMFWFLAVGGAASGAGLLAVAFRGAAEWPDAPAFLFGLAVGGNLSLALMLLRNMFPARGAPQVLSLAGASLGMGGFAAHLVATAAVAIHAVDALALGYAGVPILLSVGAYRSRRFRLAVSAGGSSARTSADDPRERSRMLTASLAFQAAAGVVAASWCVVYLARGFGATAVRGAAVAALAWLLFVVGWTLASRLRHAGHWLGALGVPPLLGSLGALALGSTTGLLGAIGGAMLLGMGLGGLLAFTMQLARWPVALARRLWLGRTLRLALPTGLLATWPVGELVAAFGIEVVAWAILGCVCAAFAALLLQLAERPPGDAPATA